MFFDPRDRNLQGPMSQPEPLPSLPPDSAVDEMVTRFSAEWEATRSIERSNSRELMFSDAIQPFLDAYKRETGQELSNPYEIPEGALAQQGGIGPSSEGRGPMALGDERARAIERARERYEAARRQPGDRRVSQLPQWPEEEELRERAISRAKTARERAERAEALSFTGAGTLGGAAGMIGSVMADPVNLASLFVGAAGGASLLRTMATEAAVGMGAEALVQPRVMAWKRELGDDPTLLDAAVSVATAGVGAGVLGGVLKGAGLAGAAGWRRVRPHLTRQERAALHVTDALDTLDRRNPFEIARRARLRGERTGQAPQASFADELRVSAADSPAFTLEIERLGREVAAVRAGSEAAPTARLDHDPIEAGALHRRALREAEASLANGRAPDGPAIRAIDEEFGQELELPVWEARTSAGKTTRWRGPMDLITWARTIGGLKDSGGELRSRDLDKLNGGRQGVEWARGEVFLGRLVNDRGMSLDDAALAAWEAGFFPGFTSRPTSEDLLAALDRTHRAGSAIEGRVWSEHDADLVEQLRGRIDPDEEAHWREVLGDEAFDDALDAIDGMPVISEPMDPDIQAVLRNRAAGRHAEGETQLVDFDDEAERIALEALQEDLAAGDFRVSEEVTADGNVIAVDRSAREVWRDTETDAAGLVDAAACMTRGVA